MEGRGLKKNRSRPLYRNCQPVAPKSRQCTVRLRPLRLDKPGGVMRFFRADFYRAPKRGDGCPLHPAIPPILRRGFPAIEEIAMHRLPFPHLRRASQERPPALL